MKTNTLTRFALAAALAAAPLAFLPGCEKKILGPVYPHGTRPADAKILPILASAASTDATIKAPSVAILRTADQLKAVGGDAAKLTVDFNTQMVVLVALGEKTSGGYWTRIISVHHTKGVVWVDGVANRPGPGAPAISVINSPYAAVVVERVDDALLVSDITSVEGENAPGEGPVITPSPAQ